MNSTVAHAFHRATTLAAAMVLVSCGSSSGGEQTDAGPSSPATDSSPACKATVTQGALQGKAAGSTCEYLGVPYGAPPTGSMRFMPPQPAPAWTSTRTATSFGPSCLQAGSLLGSVGSTDEDCLSVNVFTPKAAPAGPLPVMVFIYGGAFTSGSSSTYDGEAISERGPVVVVSMNYRLGALGFLALPQLDAARSGAPSGSDGIRDQQLALKWVHDNVATFHGDPANVTVFGESAGSMSTCIHVVSPGSQPYAKRYIMESGSCISARPLQLNTQAQSYQLGEQLATATCSGADGDAVDAGGFDPTSAGVLTCLQNASASALMTWVPPPGSISSPQGQLLGNLLGPPFAPTVEGKGGVLPDTPLNLVKAGQYDKDAQLLIGTNENEFGLFVDLATSPLGGGTPTAPRNKTSAAQRDQGLATVFGAQAAAVEAQYPATDATAPQVFIDLLTDYVFRCPSRDLLRTTMGQGTTTAYEYSYDIGKAWHSFELVPLFDVTALSLLGAATPSSAYDHVMQGYWTQFAATGNPNAPADAGAPAWPAYSPTTDPYLELLDPAPMAGTGLRKAQCDFWSTFP